MHAEVLFTRKQRGTFIAFPRDHTNMLSSADANFRIYDIAYPLVTKLFGVVCKNFWFWNSIRHPLIKRGRKIKGRPNIFGLFSRFNFLSFTPKAVM